MGRESEVVSAEEQPEATGDERAEIELRRRLVREAKIANMRAGGRGNLSPDELDAVIPPTDCWRTRNRLRGAC